MASPDMDLFININILGNTIVLAMANPLQPDREGINGTLFWFNLAFNIVFSVEMLLKMMSLGLVPPWKGVVEYFKDAWNIFDAFMVAVGWLIMIPPQTTNSNINTLRALRALRPLRTISRFESIKYVVRGCFAALPLLASVYLLVLLFLWVFSIVGLLAFNSTYHYLCIDQSYYNITEADYFSYDDPDMSGCGSWRYCPANFTCTFFQKSTATNEAGWDNIGTSLLTLIQLLTLTGWDFIMYRSMSSSSPFAVIFYMIITLMGSYFLMNLIIAVLKLKFARFCKLEQAKRQTLKTLRENETPSNIITRFCVWLIDILNTIHRISFRNEMIMSVKKILMHIALKEEPLTPSNPPTETKSTEKAESHEQLVPVSEFSAYVQKYFDRISRFQRALIIFRYRVYALQKSTPWTLFILTCIATSILMLSFEHSDMNTNVLWQLVEANWALTCIFFIDVVLRIIPLSASELFQDGWTLLNIILIGFGIAEVVMEAKLGVWGIQQNLTLRSIRSLRVLRGFIFIQASKPMMAIARIIAHALVSYAAIAILIFLFWVVFAIVGMNVFGQQMLDLTYLGYAGYPNFSSFLSSMVISFQVLTLENYQQTMYSLVRAAGWGAVTWFLIWIVIGKYTFLSLFLAVTLEAFDDTGEEPTGVPPLDDTKRRDPYAAYLHGLSDGGHEHSSSMVMTEGPRGTYTTQSSRNRTADVSVISNKLSSDQGSTSYSVLADFSQRAGRLWFSNSLERKGSKKMSAKGSGSPGSSKRWTSPMLSIVDSIKQKGSDAGSRHSSKSPTAYQSSSPEDPVAEGIRRLTLSKSKSDSDTSGTRAAAAAAAISDVDHTTSSEITASRSTNPGPSRLGKSTTLERQPVVKAEAVPSLVFLRQSQSMGRIDNDVNSTRRLGRIFEDPADNHEGQETTWPHSAGDVSNGPEGVRETKRRTDPDRASPTSSDRGSFAISSAHNDPEMRFSPFAAGAPTSAGDYLMTEKGPDAFDWRGGPFSARDSAAALDGSTWADMANEAESRPAVDPDRIPLTGRSLFLPEESRLRRMCYKAVTNEVFEYLVLLIVILDCVALAFDDPRDDPGCKKQRILFYCNVAFTVIISVVAALKIVAFSLVAYTSQVVNLVDLSIAIISILELILETVYPGYSGIRAMRAFQPLMMITGLRSLRKVAGNIIEAMGSVGHATVMCGVVLLMFATVGVQLFGGRSGACWSYDVTTNSQVIYPVPSIDACNGTVYNNETGLDNTLSWQNQFPNFDNVGYALLILMVATSLNGYSVFMVNAMSAPVLTNSEGGVPELNQNWAAFIFFVVFVLFCALILLNIFTGIIFSQFVKINEKEKGSAWLTDKQRQWKLLQEAVFRLKPLDPKVDLPQNKIRRVLFSVVRHKLFRSLILLITLLNVIVLSLYHYNMSHQWLLALEWANVGFVTAFTLELVMKVVALGPEAYWQDGWNKFDVIVVVIALIDLAVTFIFATTEFRVIRLLAIERILRSMKLVAALASYQGIKLLYVTLVVSLPAFSNIGLLIFLIFFIYAYLGVQAFYNLALPGSLNYRVNFRSFPNALITLLRIATCDNWSDFAFQMIPDYFGYGGVCPPENDCGSWLSIPYSITFLFFISYILLNLFMAVIIEAYEKHSEMMHYDKVTPLILDEFVWTWVNYDVEGTASVKPEALFKLLKVLGQPLGLRSDISDEELEKFSSQLKIPLKKGRIPFHQTIFELVKSACEEAIPESTVKDELDKAYVKFLRDGGHDDADDAAKDEAALARLAKQIGHFSLYHNTYAESAALSSGTMARRQDSRGGDSIPLGQHRADSGKRQLTSMRSKGPTAIKSGLDPTSSASDLVVSPDSGALGLRQLSRVGRLSPPSSQSPTRTPMSASSDKRDEALSTPPPMLQQRSEEITPDLRQYQASSPHDNDSTYLPVPVEGPDGIEVERASPLSHNSRQLLRSMRASSHTLRRDASRQSSINLASIKPDDEEINEIS